jgi:acetyl esterase/lipase
MKHIVFLLILLFCSAFLNHSFAAKYSSNERIRIWADIKDNDINKATSELIVFTPKKSESNHSAIIICPGGSYAYLGMNVEGYEVAEWFSSIGFHVFVLKYRVGWQGYHYPAAIQDLQRSIQILRENAKKWDLDQNLIGVMGFSAGGHLAGTSAVFYNENFMSTLGIRPTVSIRPDFVIMNYPVVSMHDSIANKKSKHYLMSKQIQSKELENKLSLEDNIHAGIPPIFLMHVKGDETVDYRNSYYLYKRLSKANIPVVFHLYNGKGHGFGINTKRNKIASKWTDDCQKWFISLGINIFP